jgi:hypothetical protein
MKEKSTPKTKMHRQAQHKTAAARLRYRSTQIFLRYRCEKLLACCDPLQYVNIMKNSGGKT